MVAGLEHRRNHAGGCQIVQVLRTGKGCLAYVVASGGEAAVIDASIDPELYVDLIGRRGWTLTAVADTHVHADHLSRSKRLADLTGARLLLPAQDRVRYPFQALLEGQSLQIGAARLTIWQTPGHTAESTTCLLEKAAAFTGDTLFATGVGRPDLEAAGGEPTGRARLLYASIRRLLTLPQATLVMPGHTSQPVFFDGRPLASTIGEIRSRLTIVRLSEPEFVASVAHLLRAPPPNHSRIVELNESGDWPSDPTELEAGPNRCAAG